MCVPVTARLGNAQCSSKISQSGAGRNWLRPPYALDSLAEVRKATVMMMVSVISLQGPCESPH